MKKTFIIFSLISILGLSLFSFKSIKNDFFEIAKQIEIFTNLYKEINMNYVDEVNPAELMDTAITAMLADLDPYTVYYNEQEVQNGKLNYAANFSGIGIQVDVFSDQLLVKSVKKNSPANQSGLQIGDEIIQINQVRIDQYQDDAGTLLKGKPGSKVKLTIKRNNSTKTLKITRERDKKVAVPFYQLTGQTGYIVLSQFSRSASAEVIEAFADLKEQGATSIILDLRNNPGGLLSEAINIVNIFVEKGTTIVTTKSIIEKYNRTYVTQNRALDTQIPVAVLINSSSASASEIVSGSLQDLDRGVIIGHRSFGKGLVQRPKPLNYGTQAKITISRYYTPSGRSIQALDYIDGEAVRKTEDTYQKFTTKNGRDVFSGGGVMPDVLLNQDQQSAFVKDLVNKNQIFNFILKQSKAEMSLDEIAQINLMKDFKSYLNDTDFNYQTKTEVQLQQLKTSAENEVILKQINRQIKDLEDQLASIEDDLLQQSAEAIELLLHQELVKHQYFEEGVYQYHVKYGETVKTAVDLLNNTKKYQSTLKP